MGNQGMTNPFDNENGSFFVLVNEEGQYSLWPSHIDVPAGWNVTGPQGKRSECVAWIDEHWTDMRPLSLVRQVQDDSRLKDDAGGNGIE